MRSPHLETRPRRDGTTGYRVKWWEPDPDHPDHPTDRQQSRTFDDWPPAYALLQALREHHTLAAALPHLTDTTTPGEPVNHLELLQAIQRQERDEPFASLADLISEHPHTDPEEIGQLLHDLESEGLVIRDTITRDRLGLTISGTAHLALRRPLDIPAPAPDPITRPHPDVVNAARAYLHTVRNAMMWACSLGAAIGVQTISITLAAFVNPAFSPPGLFYLVAPALAVGYALATRRRSLALLNLFDTRRVHSAPLPPIGTHPVEWARATINNAARGTRAATGHRHTEHTD